MPDEHPSAEALASRAMHQLEEAVMRVLYELALEGRTYVRTAVIAERLGLLEQQPEPRGNIHASNIVLAVCRRLNHRGRVKNGRPEGRVHHSDKTTGWMIGTGEYHRRCAGDG